MLKQCFKCIMGIGISFFRTHFLLCQQNLGNGLIIPVKKVMIDLHQHCLTNCCRRLFFPWSAFGSGT